MIHPYQPRFVSFMDVWPIHNYQPSIISTIHPYRPTKLHIYDPFTSWIAALCSGCSLWIQEGSPRASPNPIWMWPRRIPPALSGRGFRCPCLWCLYESLCASTAATLCVNVITIRIQSLLWSERSLKDRDKPSSSLMEYQSWLLMCIMSLIQPSSTPP